MESEELVARLRAELAEKEGAIRQAARTPASTNQPPTRSCSRDSA